MRQDFFYPSADGETRIHALEWLPEGRPAATLQLCHGMAEYIARYDEFASFLAENGFYVTGNDHLGHGQSVTSPDRLGYFNDPRGNECVIADIHALRQRTFTGYPGVPHFMLGHSMGSFLLRQYIELYGEGLSGAIVMGTGLFGFVGMLLGVPVFVVIYTFLNYRIESRLKKNDLPVEAAEYRDLDHIDPVTREAVKKTAEQPPKPPRKEKQKTQEPET